MTGITAGLHLHTSIVQRIKADFIAIIFYVTGFLNSVNIVVSLPFTATRTSTCTNYGSKRLLRYLALVGSANIMHQ